MHEYMLDASGCVGVMLKYVCELHVVWSKCLVLGAVFGVYAEKAFVQYRKCTANACCVSQSVLILACCPFVCCTKVGKDWSRFQAHFAQPLQAGKLAAPLPPPLLVPPSPPPLHASLALALLKAKCVEGWVTA